MDSSVMVVLTNEQGWQKRFPLEEGVFVVGSAADARIRLPEGEGIAPYHVQLVNSSREACMRLVNLSQWEVPLKSGANDVRVQPGQLRDVFDGETIYLDALSMQFEIRKRPVQAEVVKEENHNVIGLRMVLSGQVLYPGGSLTGTLYLRNLGSEACQFDVELQGLPPECYEISPPALIHAGGEESTEIQFFHRKAAPAPGVHNFDLRVSAPDAYPGRELTIRQAIKVMPCYDYGFDFDRPDQDVSPEEPVEEPLEAVVEAVPPMPAAPLNARPVALPVREPAEISAPPNLPPDPFSHIWEGENTGFEADAPKGSVPSAPEEPAEALPPPPLAPPQPRGKRPDLSGVKVMKASTGGFLEDKDKPS